MTEMGAVESQLLRLFDSPGALGVALAVAVGVGALHAVAPGHGKTITAAYLLSGRARYRHALLLGATVAGMHTLSVGVLALAWSAASASTSLATEAVTAWLQVLAGAGVAAVGVVMVRQRRGGSGHHHHHHHPLSEDVSDGERVSSRRLVLALGAAGGLLPSPSAFLVLVSGLLTGRAGYALLLVGAFAVGMAATLAAVGVVTLRGRELLASRSGSGVLAVVHARLPMLGALGVLLGGLVYLAVALRAVAAV